MLIDFRNLLGNSAEDVERGEVERESCHIMCEVNSLFFSRETLNKKEIFRVAFNSISGPDPKVVFVEKEKAEKFYDYVISLWASKEILKIDATAYGCL